MAQSIPKTEYEQACFAKGYSIIAGLDEVGRGAWAGPVVAAAIIIPQAIVVNEGYLASPKAEHSANYWHLIRDSKALSNNQRAVLFDFLKANAQFSIGEASHHDIDKFGIVDATALAMKRAVDGLVKTPDHLLIDGRESIDIPIAQQSIIDGDALCLSIAAASIIAKVHRDRKMNRYHRKFPYYYFTTNVGYGTPAHRKAIASHGICDIHRKSFLPMRDYPAEINSPDEG